jgi:PPOX class probable FMN-dependent enzyme
MSDLTLKTLAAHYDPPRERSAAKALPHLDRHITRFIELSPFCVLATVGGDGSLDCSPRGGAPGFVRVEGPNRLLMPDRPGNNRLDSFRNLLSGSGEVALIFFVPGFDETVRVAGRASLTVDPALLAGMVEFGRPPRAVLRVEVREAMLHCAKALMRSKLWDADAQVDRGLLPSLGEMIHEQTGLGAAETHAQMQARYAETL